MNHYYDAYDKKYSSFNFLFSGYIAYTSILRRLKQKSTHELWNNYSGFLTKHFWKEHTFWSDGYFVCSVGEANPDTIRKYIESQG